MKTKEFNLSEKMEKYVFKEGGTGLFFWRQDVKEFIKILEKECCSVCEKVIRKRAGKELEAKSIGEMEFGYNKALTDVLELIDEMDGYYETIISDKCISKKELKARIEG